MAVNLKLRPALLPILLFAAVVSGRAGAAGDALFSHPADSAAIATLLRPSAQKIRDIPALRGRFEQRKFLDGLPQPLLSSGDFLFSRERGIVWHTAQPFDSTFMLTPQGMRNRDEGGTETRVDADQQPGIAAAASLFSSLFALDFAALAQNFSLFDAGTPDAWTIGLRPKQAGLASVFREARISGGDHVREVDMIDGHGDRTEIRLSDIELLKAGLTKQQQAGFDR